MHLGVSYQGVNPTITVWASLSGWSDKLELWNLFQETSFHVSPSQDIFLLCAWDSWENAHLTGSTVSIVWSTGRNKSLRSTFLSAKLITDSALRLRRIFWMDLLSLLMKGTCPQWQLTMGNTGLSKRRCMEPTISPAPTNALLRVRKIPWLIILSHWICPWMDFFITLFLTVWTLSP